MGEGIRQAMATVFVRRSNKAYNKRLAEKTLFSSQVVTLSHKFRCRASTGLQSLGGKRAVELVQIGQTLKIVHGNAELGTVCDDEALELLNALRDEPMAGGFMPAHIVDDVGLDGCFRIVPDLSPDEPNTPQK